MPLEPLIIVRVDVTVQSHSGQHGTFPQMGSKLRHGCQKQLAKLNHGCTNNHQDNEYQSLGTESLGTERILLQKGLNITGKQD